MDLAIADRDASEKLWRTMERGRTNRAEGIANHQIRIEEMKEADRRIKSSALADPTLVEEFASSVRKNGGHVYLAKTGEEANRYVADLAKMIGAKLIVKSKSLTTEEIEFNRYMEEEGVRCVETDLGELVVQLRKERPVHLVAPSAHLSTKDIAEVFSRELGKEIPVDPEAILAAVRQYLRPLYFDADIGVTGANMCVAETGSIVVETNEGNARLVASLPRVHVVIVGTEKVIASWRDVAQLLQAHGISSTGQSQTVYVSIFSQHGPIGGSSEGRELHVVILDNGRSKMRANPWFSDALNCIRCGACMNICPTYGIVGGHVFGYIYPGPIGIPWTEEVHGLDKMAYSHLCISCGLCKEICPVDIDMPMMIARVKEQEIALHGQLRANSFFASSERLARLASATAPLSNWLITNSFSRYLLEKAVGVDRRRTLPTFSRRRLRSILNASARKKGTEEGASGKVVFFPDIYADYNDPGLGVRAVGLLEDAGYSVEVPERLRWGGMPYVSYGELRKAAQTAEHNLGVLEPYVSAGFAVTSTEPNAVYMLREVYPTLVPGRVSAEVRKSSTSFFALLQRHLRDLNLTPSYPTDAPLGFHIPCHLRALDNGAPAMAFLEAAGYAVRLVETGTCCGMAGTFGMKQGALGYDLSMAVGDRLFKLFRESECNLVTTESSVCATQIIDGTGIRVAHPVYLMRPPGG